MVAIAADRVRVTQYRTAVVVDGESTRQRWPSQPVGDVKQPTSDQHPLGRHGDPRHLVAPVRLLLPDRDEPLIDTDWRRRSPPPPVADRPPDASGPAHAVGGQLLFEATSRGVTDGHLVAPEQQRRLLGREQLGHEHGELLTQLADGRVRRRLTGPRALELPTAVAILLVALQPTRDP